MVIDAGLLFSIGFVWLHWEARVLVVASRHFQPMVTGDVAVDGVWIAFLGDGFGIACAGIPKCVP